MADTGPKDNLKRLVIYINGSDKNHNNNIQIPPAKQQKQLLYTVKIAESSIIHNCKHCGYRTMVQELLKKHMRVHQTPKPKITIGRTGPDVPDGFIGCPECSYYSKTESSLKIHMKIHSKGTPYKCTECEFLGKDLKELIKHYAETKNFNCDVCVYATHVRAEMMAHQRRHTGQKVFVCGICNYSSTDRSNLHRHLKCHDMPS